jgi:hypothetical protein
VQTEFGESLLILEEVNVATTSVVKVLITENAILLLETHVDAEVEVFVPPAMMADADYGICAGLLVLNFFLGHSWVSFCGAEPRKPKFSPRKKHAKRTEPLAKIWEE